jgi:hypothetical protein
MFSDFLDGSYFPAFIIQVLCVSIVADTLACDRHKLLSSCLPICTLSPLLLSWLGLEFSQDTLNSTPCLFLPAEDIQSVPLATLPLGAPDPCTCWWMALYLPWSSHPYFPDPSMEFCPPPPTQHTLLFQLLPHEYLHLTNIGSSQGPEPWQVQSRFSL